MANLSETSTTENSFDTLQEYQVEGDNDIAMSLSLGTKWMLQTVPVFILVLGTFGNIMIILLFSRSRSFSSLNLFFEALAISDLCLLYSGLFPLWIEHTFGFVLANTHKVACKLIRLFYYTVGILSAWIVVAMTTQRAASVVWPHKVNVMCTIRNARYYVIAMTAFFLMVNSHFLYGVTHVTDINGTFMWCGTGVGAEEYRFFLYKIWPWVDTFLFSLFPVIILIVSNSVIVWKVTDSVRKARVTLASGQSDQLSSRTKKVSSMTLTLIAVSLAFFLLTAPLCAHFIILPYLTPYSERDHLGQEIIMFAYQLMNLLWYTNSAINFYLYCLTGTNFRNDACIMLCLTKKETIMASNTQTSQTVISEKADETEF
ncbi:G-protein coupled receptor daf-37-like [Littorina saxatilis]|uniref:G-protein coupled receptor daf-37-like n=1 Tax=Littorina saxatilis TaxID=31220 RepID=UPI0038B5B45C